MESVVRLMAFDINFYKGKKIFVTGHTGFKGTWLCAILMSVGANVIGYSNGFPTNPSLFELVGMGNKVNSINGDVRDYNTLRQTIDKEKPEIIIHMAAQPLVRESYLNPLLTYETNVMGTVNILECIRNSKTIKSFLNVTTDKVYLNKEWTWGYRENDELDGYDPYSNSKSCSELVTHSYKKCFFQNTDIAISTARAGNVIGGGDFAKDRIIPDCVKSAIKHQPIVVRNPYSIRPYQHVLEPLFAYLMIAGKQYSNNQYQGYYNVGPDDDGCYRTGDLVEQFVNSWGEGLEWKTQKQEGPHEAGFLKLDCSQIKSRFGWHPVWKLSEAIDKVVEWSKCWDDNQDVYNCMIRQINDYQSKWNSIQ